MRCTRGVACETYIVLVPCDCSFRGSFHDPVMASLVAATLPVLLALCYMV